MKNPLVSVIIPVYNRADVVKGCLDSLKKQTYPKDRMEIIIADDGSIDNIEGVAKEYEVKLVTHEHKGLPATRNLGMKNAIGEIIVFFDDDTIVHKDWIKNVVEVYEKYDNVGGVTGKIKNVHFQEIKKGVFGKIMKIYAKIFGISGFFVMQDGIGKVLPTGFTITNFHEVDHEQKVQILSGCNMSYSKKAIEEVGYFDNEYIGNAYYEDPDFSYRVYKEGFDLFAIPNAEVDHLVTPISREKLHKLKYYQLVNQKRFFHENVYEGSWIRRLKNILAHVSLFSPVLMYSILIRDFRLFKSYIKAETGKPF